MACSGEREPAGQVRQEVEPFVGRYRPPGHASQRDVCPALVGLRVGAAVGALGLAVGTSDGAELGLLVGAAEGASVGLDDGADCGVQGVNVSLQLSTTTDMCSVACESPR